MFDFSSGYHSPQCSVSLDVRMKEMGELAAKSNKDASEHLCVSYSGRLSLIKVCLSCDCILALSIKGLSDSICLFIVLF